MASYNFFSVYTTIIQEIKIFFLITERPTTTLMIQEASIETHSFSYYKIKADFRERDDCNFFTDFNVVL